MEANSAITQNLIVAEIQLVYKSKVKPSESPTANSSRRAYDVLMADGTKEELNSSYSLEYSC